jgi:hypothetical protein
MNIQWTSTSTIPKVNIYYVDSNGVKNPIITRFANVAGDNTYPWTIPLTLATSTNYHINIRSSSNASVNGSSASFKLTAPITFNSTNSDSLAAAYQALNLIISEFQSLIGK